MKKKRGLQIVKRSVSSVSQQQPQMKDLYIGNKAFDNHSVHGGASYKRRKFGDGGCGCGSNPKQVRRQAK